MNATQTILSLGAMMLLSLILMRVNETILYTDDTVNYTKLDLIAISLGSSVIEEANRLSFDQMTDTACVNSLKDLTSPARLGQDAGETDQNSNLFNDFDDYNNYTRVDSTLPSEVFYIRSTVTYVDSICPDIVSASRTWHKRLDVYVTSPSLNDTVCQSFVFSYWYFR